MRRGDVVAGDQCVFERRSAAPPPLRSFVYNSVELKYDVFMCMTKELAL